MLLAQHKWMDLVGRIGAIFKLVLETYNANVWAIEHKLCYGSRLQDWREWWSYRLVPLAAHYSCEGVNVLQAHFWCLLSNANLTSVAALFFFLLMLLCCGSIAIRQPLLSGTTPPALPSCCYSLHLLQRQIFAFNAGTLIYKVISPLPVLSGCCVI